MAIEVVSVHFPKSGGTSLRESLKAAYGADAILYDYEDDPADPCSPFNLDPDGCREEARARRHPETLKVIHGHFHVSKYDHISDARRITFLRHPIETMISIHYYWKTLKEGGGLFGYCAAKDLDIVRLARLPLLRRLFSQTYFGGVDMRQFDFVGVTECYDLSIRRLSEILGIEVVETRQNVNQYPAYEERARAIREDAVTMNKLRALLSDDIRFYERMVERIVA